MMTDQASQQPSSNKPSGVSWWTRGLLLLIPLLMVTVVFEKVIFQGEQLAYRDAGIFYYPLFERIQSYWDAGVLPLWEPNENLGGPLAANAPASVFYPGKLIFFLPRLLPVDYPWCYKTYIILHTFFCFFSMYALARYWRHSRTGSIIGALAYSFGGPVLFQYSNVIFLVGAAWLPLAIWAGDLVLRKRTIRAVLFLAFVLGMMVLGGDPEMAYLAGLMLVGLALTYWGYGFFQSRTATSLKGGLGLLVSAALLAGLMTAFQVLPSAEWGKESDRKLYDHPISVWDVPSYVLRHRGVLPASPFFPQEEVTNWEEIGNGIFKGLCCAEIEETGHVNRIYMLSVYPLQFLELIFPNFCGTLFPSSTQWIFRIDFWTSSIYLGIVPLLLAFSVFQLRRLTPVTTIKKLTKRKSYTSRQVSSRQVIRRWASWLCLLAFLGALGGYGPLWWARWILTMSEETNEILNYDPVGGVYWLMNVLLPGFSSFRFPAKLLTPFVLGIAVLAVIGWDTARRQRIFRRGIQIALVGSVFFLVLTVLFGKHFFPQQGDPTFPDALRMYNQNTILWVVVKGIIQTIIVLSLFLIFSLILQRTRQKGYLRPKGVGVTWKEKYLTGGNLFAFAVVLLLMIDLSKNAYHFLGTIPQEDFNRQPEFARLIQDHATIHRNDNAPIRFYNDSLFSYLADDEITVNRLSKATKWDRALLIPKHFLSTGLANVDSQGTMTNIHYAIFIDWVKCNQRSWSLPVQLAFLGCDYVILPTRWSKLFPAIDAPVPDAFPMERLHVVPETTESLPGGFPMGTTLWYIKGKKSRLRIYHDLPALIEPQATAASLPLQGTFDGREQGEFAKFTKYRPNHINLEVKLQRPGDLLFLEQYAPDWKATYRSQEEPNATLLPLEVHRSLQFCRRISLPAGHFEVEMNYHPDSFYRGVLLGGVGWLLFFVLLIRKYFLKISMRFGLSFNCYTREDR